MSKKVLILGGGVVGLCSAYYAAQRGHAVTVLDREVSGASGCSMGNAGMIVPSHFIPLAAPGMMAYGLKTMWNPESPFYLKPRLSFDLLSWGWNFWKASSAERVKRAAPVLRDMHFLSRSLYEEFHGKTDGAFNLVRKGLLMLCKTQHALDEEAHVAEQARALGVPADVLDAKQTAALDPTIKMDVPGSVHYPKDCHLSPSALMRTLEDEARKLGVEFRRETIAQKWVVNGSKIDAIETSNGTFAADEFVLCGGIWSDDLARGLNLRIPMQAGKGYSVTLDAPHHLPELCSILVEARVAVTPMNGKLRFGGTMELSGISSTINETRVRGIIKSALKYFPEFSPNDFKNLPAWTGMRPCSPDGMPYLGRTKRYGNLIVATGHAMMGISLAPATGKMVAETLSDEKPSVEIGLLNPERYA
ncbi:MAG: FAD-dependent oxidoreductase [Planctomycetota bacterium]